MTRISEAVECLESLGYIVIPPLNPRVVPAVAVNVRTGTRYIHVDWSNEATGYVLVDTGKSQYIARKSSVRRLSPAVQS